MIAQPTQHHELPRTPRTVVNLLPVRRTAQMLVQRPQRAEPVLAEVAAVPVAIPGGVCGKGGGIAIIIVVPADLLVGEDVVRIDFAAVAVNFLAVDAGGAGTGFEVQADAGEVGEFVGAPGAFDVTAGVDRGLKMLLFQITRISM